MWWPKCLTYGNWGGPGWSGGEFVSNPKLVRWWVRPVDNMDAAFKRHDWAYQRGGDRRYADRVLVTVLRSVNVKGAWANIYRIGAIGIFWVRSRF